MENSKTFTTEYFLYIKHAMFWSALLFFSLALSKMLYFWQLRSLLSPLHHFYARVFRASTHTHSSISSSFIQAKIIFGGFLFGRNNFYVCVWRLIKCFVTQAYCLRFCFDCVLIRSFGSCLQAIFYRINASAKCSLLIKLVNHLSELFLCRKSSSHQIFSEA